MAAFLVVAIVMPLSWSQSGQTASTCTVERGIDPLDVLNQQTIRHNVWISLDTSGSMDRGIEFDNSLPTRIDTARDVIKELLDHPDLVDGSGNPKFNWGFVFFDQEGPIDFADPGFNGAAGTNTAAPPIGPEGIYQVGNDVAGQTYISEWKCPTAASIGHPLGEPQHDNDGDGYPENPTWCKGMDATRVEAPECGDPDPRPDIKTLVDAIADGMDCDNLPNTFDNNCPAHNADGTSNGVTLDEVTEYLQTVPLLPGQKNYI
ncbi:MAG: hypothetical protein ACRD1X_03670, partial [Vicinamibacteria bacterium]